ncbi:MAG TPA: hypothetical protein VHE55_11860 [Fimbriimonadaceae bacterium]|nr:hypothetical protein [Fimbriimonadaceae bacterium]
MDPPLSNGLDACAAKLKRVESHIRDVERWIDAYAKNGYVVSRKNDPNSGEIIYRAARVKDAPLKISVVTGEALHDLRSCLDYLVWQLVSNAGNRPNRKNAFPICKSAEEFSGVTDRHLHGVPHAKVALIERLQPYHGSNPRKHPLFLLKSFNDFDKHRVLTVAHPVIWKNSYDGLPNINVAKVRVHKPLETGAELFRIAITDGTDPSQVEVNYHPSCHVFFRQEAGIRTLIPVYPLLEALRSYLHEHVFVSPGLATGFNWKPVKVQPWATWLGDGG